MNKLEPETIGEPADLRLQEIQASLRRLERQDWWLWCAAIVVMLLLSVALISLSFPVLMKEYDAFFQFHLSLAVRGLIGLVLLFSVYTIYQQILIKRLRRQLAQQMGLAAKLYFRSEEFQQLAMRDPLTGLYNRRFAEQRLAVEVSRSRRKGYPFAVLVLDLNDLKQINDRYGHSAGDFVLKEFAERLKTIRVSDLAVRTGGDEFMVILPECNRGQVECVLARLAHLEVDFRGHKIPMTFSAGWADYQASEEPEQLLERADQALYADKQAKKGRKDPIKSPAFPDQHSGTQQ